MNTQETATREAMGWKRALWYVLAVGFILFGVLSALISYFGVEYAASSPSYSAYFDAENSAPNLLYGTSLSGTSWVAAIAILMVFALPGLALLVFLILMEKDRKKPWVKAWTAKQQELHGNIWDDYFANPARAQRFGLLCGALWIAAIASFVVLTILFGVQFSWLAFVAALVVQMVIMASLAKAG